MPQYAFNPPPGWPKPPAGWLPPAGWEPDPSWPKPPDGWQLFVAADASTPIAPPDTPLMPAPVLPPPPTPPPVAQPPTSEVEVLRAKVAELQEELEKTRAHPVSANSADLVDLDDERVLQEVGIYNYHHPLENSQAFSERLASLQQRIRGFVLDGQAILASDLFTYNNSLAKGRRMTNDFSKLMLRAYNAEADNCVRSLRAGNVVTAVKRLESAVAAIARLGQMMEMRVNPDYHALRGEELELTADFQMMVQHEREAAREERERLREERKAEQELAAERERLEKERAHFANALAAITANGDDEAANELQQKLEELDRAIALNDYRTANIRAGYVYVISNPGALGRHVVKIGMTRRLEPMERIRELGDASVPFPYEVHALYFSEDAVTLESELHQVFADARVNRVNERREFFFATPHQVREVLAQKVGNLLEYNEEPEATEYYQSRKYWKPQLLQDPQ